MYTWLRSSKCAGNLFGHYEIVTIIDEITAECKDWQQVDSPTTATSRLNKRGYSQLYKYHCRISGCKPGAINHGQTLELLLRDQHLAPTVKTMEFPFVLSRSAERVIAKYQAARSKNEVLD